MLLGGAVLPGEGQSASRMRTSPPGKIHLLLALAWTDEDETCDKREHGTKGNGRQSTVIFSLDTAVPHAPSFTGFPSLNALSAEGCGAFTVRLCWGPAFMNHVLGEVQGRADIHRADFVNTGKPPG